MAQKKVKEGSAAFFTFTFRDETDTLVVPISIDWRIDDITDGVETPIEVVGWTAVGAPASSIDVVSEGSNQDMLDNTRVREERVLTVRVDSGQTTQAYEWEHFRVMNAHGAP